MAELKTKVNDGDVVAFLNSVEDEAKRKDSFEILKMMKKSTRATPKMWGDSIIGFGSYRYKYASGREGDWFWIGLSPRKQNISLYFMSGFEHHEKNLSKLGKHKIGRGCLYVKRLDDIDRAVLKELIDDTVAHFRKKKE